MQANVFEAAERCLAATQPTEKVALTQALRQAWLASELTMEPGKPVQPIGSPGRPERPHLVAPQSVPKRRLGTIGGRAALIHAVTHIEFNAINLALDAVYRFRGLPPAYYDDWLRVADEECHHFSLLERRLRELGYAYGDFEAHGGLWAMAMATAEDWLARMALVPRVMEARGLDVTPGMIERLVRAGDRETAAILEIILREEIGHVAAGSRWFRYGCEQAGLPMEATFLRLLRTYYQGTLKGPFNESARLAAGFTASELEQFRLLAVE